MREVYAWSQLRHDNVQELLGIIMFQDSLGMVSPWMERGNLQHYIETNPGVARHPLVCPILSLTYPILFSACSVYRRLRVCHTFTTSEWYELLSLA